MFEDALRRAVAEFIGAFTLIFIGAGAAVAANQIHDPTLIGVAIANGLAIGVMVSAMGHISGAHFNPAITFGFLITRRIKPALAVALLGRPAGRRGARRAARARSDSSRDHRSREARCSGDRQRRRRRIGVRPGGNHDVLPGVGGVRERRRRARHVQVDRRPGDRPDDHDRRPLRRPVHRRRDEPARAFGPQLVGDYWSNAWVWYAGPIAGAAVAAVLYEFLYLRPAELEAVGSSDSGVLEPRAGESA